MGYLIKPARWWERALLVAAALLLIDPGLTTDLLGLAAAGLAATSQAVRRSVRAWTPALQVTSPALAAGKESGARGGLPSSGHRPGTA